MKSLGRKLTAVLLSCGMVLMALPSIVLAETAEPYVMETVDGVRYRYYLNGGYCTVDSLEDDTVTGTLELAGEVLGHPVTGIEEYALKNCEMTSLILPDSITWIGDYAFRYCKNLELIQLSAGLTSLSGVEAEGYYDYTPGYATWVYGCDNLKALTVSSASKTFQSVNGILYSKDGKTLFAVPKAVPYDTVDLSAVTRIGAYAFYDHQEITSFTVPEGIESIGAYAFGKTSMMQEISLPDSLSELGKGAFMESGLRHLQIPDGVSCIPENLCCAVPLREITLPGSVASIGERAFYNAILYMDTLELPEGLKTIGDYAFATSYPIDDSIYRRETDPHGLLQVSIPDSVSSIGNYAFLGNRNLTELRLPASDTEICSHAFEDCGILALTLPERTKRIADYTFYGCRMRNLVIPEGVTEIACEAFSHCTALRQVVLPSTLQKIGMLAFENAGGTNDFGEHTYTGITSIVVPEGVTEIDYGAFTGSNLLDVQLPDTLKTLGFRAFDNTNLAVLEYPKGITKLNAWYTMGCENLNAIYLPDTLESIEPLAIAKNADLSLFVFHEDRVDTAPEDYSVSNLELVPDVYFAGTEQEWKALTKNWDFSKYDTDSSVMDKVTVHFNAKRQSSLLGDVNADGQFTVADMVLLQKWLIGKGILHSPDNGDMNGDGILNSWDLVRMRRALLGAQPQEALG